MILGLLALAQVMVLNPAVTQETIGSTICVPYWTSRVRPHSYYTNAIKHKFMREQGVTKPARYYELNHRMPLALGGAPYDIRNLELQLKTGPRGANKTDNVERRLHDAVCLRHTLTLEQARQQMMDWSNQ